MKYKKHFEVHEYPITALLSQDSIDMINKLMEKHGYHFTRIVEFKKVRVKRQYRLGYLARLMKHRPGIDREGNEGKEV